MTKRNKVDIPRALLASVAAGNAYLVTMWLDNHLSSYQFNDLKLTGQIWTTKSPTWEIVGVANHFAFSAGISTLYALWGYSRLPGPPWLRGALFMQMENALLYPVAKPLERYHAGERSGQLPTIFSWKTFWGQVLRHLAFGVTLGLVYRPKK